VVLTIEAVESIFDVPVTVVPAVRTFVVVKVILPDVAVVAAAVVAGTVV
jgi:predicted benzoate:H+ symporter BenE